MLELVLFFGMFPLLLCHAYNANERTPKLDHYPHSKVALCFHLLFLRTIGVAEFSEALRKERKKITALTNDIYGWTLPGGGTQFTLTLKRKIALWRDVYQRNDLEGRLYPFRITIVFIAAFYAVFFFNISTENTLGILIFAMKIFLLVQLYFESTSFITGFFTFADISPSNALIEQWMREDEIRHLQSILILQDIVKQKKKRI